ncbi:hypothetical protein ASU31_08105 [Pedobacter ginsenosidimutans]|uniref:Uncharacterized protein n=1 Tax=Pedobacter ginsenosidimutans TaxID=687842 RepID=A0A0T5VSP4_9SPHI|nr:hypothetical protein ASU31_08105 [Pedobacter ginsenosidimutans]
MIVGIWKTGVQRFFGYCSPAFHFKSSPDENRDAGFSFQSGLGTKQSCSWLGPVTCKVESSLFKPDGSGLSFPDR